MTKVLTTFRLEKEELAYLDEAVKGGNFSNKTQAISKFIQFYKQENGFRFELKQKFAFMVEKIYSNMIPFLFGCLFAWFFLKRSLLFIPFLVIALTPFVLKIEAKNKNTIKVSL